MLNTLSKNKYTVKDSLHFVKEICEQNLSLTKGSLDVDSLFTNNTLDETINFCINQLFENTDAVESSTKAELNNCYVWLQTSPILYSWYTLQAD